MSTRKRPPSRRCTPDCRGFTLIELLIVITIITILAALLFPTLQRARKEARKTLCLSNERQITLGLFSYCNEANSYFPAPFGNYNWDDMVSDYLGLGWSDAIKAANGFTEPGLAASTNIFRCPEDTTPPATEGEFRRSYVVNEYDNHNGLSSFKKCPGLISQPDYTASVRLSRVNTPEKTLLLAEQWRDWNTCGRTGATGTINGYKYVRLVYFPGTPYYLQLQCHDKGRAVLSMADGSSQVRYGGDMLEGSVSDLGYDFRGSWLDHSK